MECSSFSPTGFLMSGGVSNPHWGTSSEFLAKIDGSKRILSFFGMTFCSGATLVSGRVLCQPGCFVN